jgi:eukaryotic-like serine/threonine-protein kinase
VPNELAEPTRRESQAPPSRAPSPSVLAGRYKVIALLGVGGMGSVYLAEDIELGEKVALKMLRFGGSGADAIIDRMRSEVRLARRVTHPNVARMYDIGEFEGERFLTLEFVDGESLGARIARDGPLDEASFFRVAKDLTRGLAAAHAAGVVHRDLKPHNILLAKDGRAVITDFGTAGSPDTEPEGLVIGTPSFMAPEQLEGRFDVRSDIFGLGAVFYCMLTGAKPFDGTDRSSRAPNPRDLRPGLSAPLGALVARCLELDPKDRFPSAEALQAAIEAAPASPDADESLPSTLSSSAAANVLRALHGQPRHILLQATADTENRSVAQGLREEVADLLNENAALHALRDEKGAHEASAEVAVRRDGDTMILDVRVVGAREGFEFWRGSFEGAAGDAIGLARAAAEGIERAMAIVVPRLRAQKPLGQEAGALYLAGRAAYRNLWPDSVRKATAAFEQALVLSPDHPLLLAALATSLARQSFFDEALIESAREAGERAVRLAPDLADAHFARGTILIQDSDAEGAMAALLQSLELAPGHVDALTSLGEVLLELGAPADCVRIAEASVAREPLQELPLSQIARVHALLGHWDRASATLERAQADGMTSFVLALQSRFAMWRRDRRPIKAIMDGLRAAGAPRHAMHNRISFVIGEAVLECRSPRADPEHLRTRYSSASTRRRRTFVLQIEAEVDAYLGDHTNALASIEAAVGYGLFDTFWLERCPLFDDYRGSGRFEDVRDVVRARARRALGHVKPSA